MQKQELLTKIYLYNTQLVITYTQRRIRPKYNVFSRPKYNVFSVTSVLIQALNVIGYI